MAAPKESPTTSIRFGSTVRPSPPRALRPDREPSAIVVAIGGAMERADIPGLCERARELLEGSDADALLCDVSALFEPDATTVDALARLQLTARRLGRRLLLLDACGELKELIDLVGLADVVPPCVELPLEMKGQIKEREQGSGVEEEADPGDPPV